MIGFSFEKKIYDNENKGKIQSLLFIDILLNLPNSESFNKISESLESEFYQNHQEYAKKTIDFLWSIVFLFLKKIKKEKVIGQ